MCDKAVFEDPFMLKHCFDRSDKAVDHLFQH